MRFMKQFSPRVTLVYALMFGLGTAFGMVPCSFVATTASAADEAEPTVTIVKGKFVEFKDNVLRVKINVIPNDVVTVRQWEITAGTEVVSHIRGEARKGTAPDAFKLWEPDAVIAVTVQGKKVTFVELGIEVVKRTPDRTPDKPSGKTADDGDKKPTIARGRFVSMKTGILTIEANSGELIESRITANTKTSVWHAATDKYVPAETGAAFEQVKPGTWIIVDSGNETLAVRIGSRKGNTVGTFVSFKNDRLLMLGKDLGERFTKKYGNNLHFNKFRNDVPAYESVDGGAFKLIGMANKVLADVKEGTLITVHGEGDDNITLVQIGVPKK